MWVDNGRNAWIRNWNCKTRDLNLPAFPKNSFRKIAQRFRCWTADRKIVFTSQDCQTGTAGPLRQDSRVCHVYRKCLLQYNNILNPGILPADYDINYIIIKKEILVILLKFSANKRPLTLNWVKKKRELYLFLDKAVYQNARTGKVFETSHVWSIFWDG